MTTRSRSTVLYPMQVLLGFLLTATIGAVHEKAPAWLLVLLAVFDCIALMLYVGAYVYLLPRDRDALRSERFALHKLAIEKGFVGDSLVGRVDPDKTTIPLLTKRPTDEDPTR